ncbi:aminoacyl-tRNA deacylase [Actinomadura viridis]|uniref:Prolyl-tRNA editing enzyme YbaK/EbsC (Cys-tRNA(Pro) deacylase) n=1 Tax=Actinomadura viridis TaxID=58110 RepID=A0A931DTB3_9ACTN|nr:hypothetical protein [Actinomadura viridis]MBG6092288.1 prolyl-tRNA editing enzyme YbaK/EbsC (Cys-tRNA(Pro) deacylase) [Actinomadura viridis]
MKDALTIHRALLERETPHEIVRLPRSIARADDLPWALGTPPRRCLVTRVFACDDACRDRRFLTGVIMAAGDGPPPERVRSVVGARAIRPARADLVNAVTEYAADLVCPLLLPASMPLLIDRGVVDAFPADGVVYTATGEASTALGIRARDLYALSRAEPVRFFRRAEHRTPPAAAHFPASPGASPAPGPAAHGAAAARAHRHRGGARGTTPSGT